MKSFPGSFSEVSRFSTPKRSGFLGLLAILLFVVSCETTPTNYQLPEGRSIGFGANLHLSRMGEYWIPLLDVDIRIKTPVPGAEVGLQFFPDIVYYEFQPYAVFHQVISDRMRSGQFIGFPIMFTAGMGSNADNDYTNGSVFPLIVGASMSYHYSNISDVTFGLRFDNRLLDQMTRNKLKDFVPLVGSFGHSIWYEPYIISSQLAFQQSPNFDLSSGIVWTN